MERNGSKIEIINPKEFSFYSKINKFKNNEIIFYLFSCLVIVLLNSKKFINIISFKNNFNVSNNDTGLFKYVLERKEIFQDTLFYKYANHIKEIKPNIDFLNNIYDQFPIDKVYFNVTFLFFQIVIGLVGIIFISRKIGLSRLQSLLVVFYSFFGYFSMIGRYIGGVGFDNKFIISGFALSLGFLTIGQFINKKFKTSIVLSSFIFYLHPSHGLILLFIILSYGANLLLRKKIEFYRFLRIFLLLPFILNIKNLLNLFKVSSSLSSDRYQEWVEFLKAKTSNPFPLQDGIIINATLIILFILGAYFIGKNSQICFKENNNRAIWVIGCVVLLFFMQVISSELFKLQPIALGLTRSCPYALVLSVIGYISFFTKNNTDKSLNWLFFLSAPAFSFLNPLFQRPIVLRKYFSLSEILERNNLSISPENVINEVMVPDKQNLLRNNFVSFLKTFISIFGNHGSGFSKYNEGFLLLLSISLIYIIYNFIKSLKRKKVYKFVKLFYFLKPKVLFINGLILISLLGIILSLLDIFNSQIYLINFIRIVIFTIIILQSIFYRTSLIIKQKSLSKKLKIKKINIIILILITITAIKPASNLFSSFNSSDSENLESQRFLELVEKTTNENDMIAVIPLRESSKFPLMPMRPTFLDWTDLQNVAYYPESLSEVKRRLKLIGIKEENFLIPQQCMGIKQYLDPMCRRKNFQFIAQQYNDDWRENIFLMKSEAPSLRYVLIKKKYSLPDDNIITSSTQWCLIKIF